MAHLYRLILGAFLTLCCLQSWASVPMVDTWCRDGAAGNMCGSKGTRAAAYEAWLKSPGVLGECGSGTYAGKVPPITVYVTDETATRLALNFWKTDCWGGGRYDNSAGGYMATFTITGSSCPANSIKSGTSCTCNAGFLEKDGQCLPPNRDDKCAGDFTLSGFALGSGKLLDTQIMKGEIPGGDMCWPYDAPGSGCTVNFVQDKVVTMPDGSKQTYGRVGMYVGPPGTTQGKACDIPAPDTTVSADCKTVGSASYGGVSRAVCADAPKCPGGFGGEVNGVEVCVKDDGANVVRSEKNTDTKNPDGSTTNVKEKTTCQGTVCTTEKTTTNTPAGGGSSTTNITNVSQPKEDYCKANANAAQCGKDGKGDGKEGNFGGSCDAGFTCEGDALQCSMAKEQHERACQLFSKKSNESLLYDGEAAKAKDRDVTATLPGNRTEDLSGKLSQENVLGGGRCITDLSVTVWHSTVTLPFSTICPQLEYMGWVLVAIASLAAFRIVSGSSKED